MRIYAPHMKSRKSETSPPGCLGHKLPLDIKMNIMLLLEGGGYLIYSATCAQDINYWEGGEKFIKLKGR